MAGHAKIPTGAFILSMRLNHLLQKRFNASDCALSHANRLFGHAKGCDSRERKNRATIRHN
jgi:hypothetical protein